MAGKQKEREEPSQSQRKRRRSKQSDSPKKADGSANATNAKKQAKRPKKTAKRANANAADKPAKRANAKASAADKPTKRANAKANAADKPTKRKNDASKAKRPRKPLTVAAVVFRVLPILSLALAFVAIVVLYRRLMPQTVDAAPVPEATAASDEVLASTSNPKTYEGLEDKWLASGAFTTGNAELDQQVKQYCDALTVEGSSARDNANNVFNNIVWSPYEQRGENEEPTGTEWATVSARHYFQGGSPADGVGGSGDVYDFAAVASYCLRYFGFTDALAVPIVKGNNTTGKVGGALVVVSDENGQECVCDPSLAAEGFMLDRSLYNITVANIGQDLSPIEARGLKVEEPPQAVNSNSSSSSANAGASSSGSSSSTSDGSAASGGESSSAMDAGGANGGSADGNSSSNGNGASSSAQQYGTQQQYGIQQDYGTQQQYGI